MKTSNKILFITTFITVAYLTVYDLGVKTEYDKGLFKSRYYHMHTLPLSNFNTIRQNAGNIVGVQVEKGPYGVWVNDDLKDKIAITQSGQTLEINRLDVKDNIYRGYETAIIISCPDVTDIVANPYIKKGGDLDFRVIRKTGDETMLEYAPRGNFVIKGFTEPALAIKVGQFVDVDLLNTNIGQLDAKVGDDLPGKASLTANLNNQIKSADFAVTGKSQLTLKTPITDKVSYKLSDSAQVTISGKASKLLNMNK